MGFFGTRSTSTNTGSTDRERQRTTQYKTKVNYSKAKKEVETKQGRDDLDNYEVKKVPVFVPGSTILNMGRDLRQKSFEVNRAYYRKNVVGKPGYEDTLDGYSNYMNARLDGEITATGNPLSQGGGGDNNRNQGIEIAKAATGTATTTGPNEIQKTATNTITTKDASKNTTDAILVANKRKSRKSTIKTSATGLEENYTLAKKKLLG